MYLTTKLLTLMYASLGTHPDISFAVTILSQYLQTPGRPHWEAIKQVFRYLKPTRDYELVIGHDNNGLHGYTDADHASQEHCHSNSGYTFIMYGSMISWSAKNQPMVALSMTKAEYISATYTAKEATWICKFLDEIGQYLTSPITLFCDNHSAITFTKDGQYHTHMKHISTQYEFIC